MEHLHLQICSQIIGFPGASQVTSAFKALLGWEAGSQPPSAPRRAHTQQHQHTDAPHPHPRLAPRLCHLHKRVPTHRRRASARARSALD